MTCMSLIGRYHIQAVTKVGLGRILPGIACEKLGTGGCIRAELAVSHLTRFAVLLYIFDSVQSRLESANRVVAGPGANLNSANRMR